jgi:2-amino-4-hydroxy-6-hydroxymethyldihydropteridine diphosphokinase
MAITYLMTGSNLGDKANNLKIARKAIENELGTLIGSSSISESEPWGFNHPEYFLNQLFVIQTSFRAQELLEKILQIEEGMGRIRKSGEYSARTIDIDILFYDDLIINTEQLTIPHPKIAVRRFVLLPLMEIDTSLVHPVTGLTIWEMYRDCRDKLKVSILEVTK